MRKMAKGEGAGLSPAGGRAREGASAVHPPAVILVKPQLGGNIGAAARAMANFGLADLRLVAPRDGWPNPDAVATAAGADALLAAARVYETTEAAVADLRYVAATTARTRDSIKPVLTPETAVREVAARSRAGAPCGLLFGPEKSGLDNDHIALCDAIVTAPVDPRFASLNLAQAVLLLGYEWMKQVPGASLGRKTPFDGPAQEGLRAPHTRLATKTELIGFFGHLERELDAAGFLWPPEKRPAMVRNLRNMFQRMGLTEQEVRTLRGIVSSLVRGGGGAGGRS